MSHLMPLLTMKLKYMDKIKRKGKGLKRKGKTAKTGKKAKRNMMRENIKKWLSGGDVNEITLEAQQEEAERLRRVEERVALMKQQNQKYLLQNSQDDVKVLTSDDELIALCKSGYRGGVEFIDTNNDGAHTDDRFNQPDEQGRVLVNVGHDKNEPPLYLAPQLSRAVKPHQIGGIRFLYDNIVECFWKHLTGSAGLGCILAHSMGLGKTLQLISFIDVYLTHTQSKYVLCIVPINTLQNWMSQFDMWLPSKKVAAFRPNSSEMKFRQFDVFMLNDCKTLFSRAKEILAWRESGGVLLIGYEMYRLLTTDGKTAKGKKVKTEETEGLPKETYDRLMCLLKAALVDPGPDLVICDEGHRLKDAATSQALKNIRTRRRIVLTGHPFQKKPIEYWCMVDFVRPNFLGTRKEFRCNFGNAIFNGQRAYSTPGDKRVMEQRVAMLHKLIRGFVQRRCLLLDHEESKLSQYEKKIAEAIYFRQKQAMTQSAGPAPKNPMIANPNFLANVPTVPTIPGKPALGRPSLYPSAGIVPPPVRSRIQTPFNVREWKRSALFDSQSMPPESTPLLSNMISQSQNHASPSSSLSMPSTSSSKPELICLDDLDDICLI